MKKQNLILGGLLLFWISLLVLFIEFKIRAAGYILPIFTVAAVVYLIFLSFNVAKDQIKNTDNKNE